MLHEIDLGRVDLNLLVLFEAVFEERHVGRAAQRLHLSPSAVSHGVGRLRRALNDPVFLKHPKGVVPTARAAELAVPIADILARVREDTVVPNPYEEGLRLTEGHGAGGRPGAACDLAAGPCTLPIAGGGEVTLSTRSGFGETPDEGWSPWSAEAPSTMFLSVSAR